MENKRIIKKAAIGALTIFLTVAATACVGAQNTPEKTEAKTTTTEQQQTAMTNEKIMKVLNANFSILGKWEYSDDCYVFYGNDDSGLEDIMEYYIRYGRDEFFTENWETFREQMKSLAKTVYESTGKKCTLAIANPVNSENVILTATEDGIAYDAFDN